MKQGVHTNSYRVFERGENETLDCGCVIKQSKTSFFPFGWILEVKCGPHAVSFMESYMKMVDERMYRPEAPYKVTARGTFTPGESLGNGWRRYNVTIDEEKSS